MAAPDALRAPLRTLDRLVERTPSDRDRVVDAVRAFSILVVLVWHWSLSITHRTPEGALVNPNPLDQVPAGWFFTWFAQVMPLFFVVGGFANCAAWRSEISKGGGARSFLRRRARRLLAPVGAFLGVWIVADAAAWALVDTHRTVLDEIDIVFNPLWFIGPYLFVVLCVPLTASAHRARPVATFAVLLGAVVAVDVVRFSTGFEPIGWLNLGLVWLLIHQLGYLWADGTLRGGVNRRTVMVTAGGLVALVALTSLAVYPRSLVATAGTEISHLSPPTVVLVAAAVLQLGVILLLRPTLARLLEGDAAWRPVVAVNAVIMTIFLWHMVALWFAIEIFEAFGGTLGSEPTLSWWLTRPLWIIGPAVLLVPLVALFAVFELGRRE